MVGKSKIYARTRVLPEPLETLAVNPKHKNERLEALTVACLVGGGSALNTCRKALRIIRKEQRD
jgi:hypothetical protein